MCQRGSAGPALSVIWEGCVPSGGDRNALSRYGPSPSESHVCPESPRSSQCPGSKPWVPGSHCGVVPSQRKGEGPDKTPVEGPEWPPKWLQSLGDTGAIPPPPLPVTTTTCSDPQGRVVRPRPCRALSCTDHTQGKKAPAPWPAGALGIAGEGLGLSAERQSHNGVGRSPPVPLGSLGRAVAGPRRWKVISQELADGESSLPGVAQKECKFSEVLISPVITVRQVSAWSWAAPAPGVGARG